MDRGSGSRSIATAVERGRLRQVGEEWTVLASDWIVRDGRSGSDAHGGGDKKRVLTQPNDFT